MARVTTTQTFYLNLCFWIRGECCKYHLAFGQHTSYENGKVISAEETPAYGLQKLLHDPAAPSRLYVITT